MEEDLEKDLLALRKLYGLLQTTGDMDEGMRLLLKNLLDSARDNLLNTKSQIIASTQLHSMQKENSTNFQPSISPNTCKASTPALHSNFYMHDSGQLHDQSLAENSPEPSSSPAVSEHSGHGISSRRPQNRKKICRVCQRTNLKRQNLTDACTDELYSNFHMHDSRKLCEQSFAENSDSGFAISSRKPQNRKKVCRFCQRKDLKQQNSTNTLKDEPGLIGHAIGFSEKLGIQIKNPEDTEGDFSKQVSNSIKLIESRISTLRLSPSCVNPKKIFDRVVQSNDGAITSGFNHNGESSKEDWWAEQKGKLQTMGTTDTREQMRMSNRNAKVDQVVESPSSGHCQNLKYIAPLERAMPLSNVANQDNESPMYRYVHGLRIPMSEDGPESHTMRMRKKLSRQITQENPLHDSMTRVKEGIGKLGRSKSSMQSKLEASTAHSSNKNLVHLLHKPTLLDYESPTSQNDDRRMSRKRGISKRPFVGLQKQKTVTYEQESDQSAMSSYTSSYSWTSLPNTEISTSSSNKSRSLANVTSESSIEDSNSSSCESSASYKDVDGDPHRDGPSKMNRSSSSKAIGRLRRFKHKLGLIFHHHHHHHHHHHKEIDTDRDDSNSNRKGQAQSRSMWKHLNTIFHHESKHKVYEKKADGKLRKSAVGKNQVGQFQALVHGTMRHVKNSKKQKLSEDAIRHGHDKSWWEMLQRSHGVKLNNTGRARLQFVSKKPQLRAPKKIT
uniref:Uncharacterized protein n=1 Tax=Manihot esculenta TaxID=3983 RepID=A0A2C9VYU7_MANES